MPGIFHKVGVVEGGGRRPSQVRGRRRRLSHLPPSFQDICPARSPFRFCKTVSRGCLGRRPEIRRWESAAGGGQQSGKGAVAWVLAPGPPDCAGGEKLDMGSGVGCNVMCQPNPEPSIGRETFNNQTSELGKSFVLWGPVRPPSTL